jgi:hypothetical protein
MIYLITFASCAVNSYGVVITHEVDLNNRLHSFCFVSGLVCDRACRNLDLSNITLFGPRTYKTAKMIQLRNDD